jgi:hypothetical protein
MTGTEKEQSPNEQCDGQSDRKRKRLTTLKRGIAEA